MLRLDCISLDLVCGSRVRGKELVNFQPSLRTAPCTLFAQDKPVENVGAFPQPNTTALYLVGVSVGSRQNETVVELPITRCHDEDGRRCVQAQNCAGIHAIVVFCRRAHHQRTLCGQLQGSAMYPSFLRVITRGLMYYIL